MADSFANMADAVSAPARRAAAVTPSDNEAIAETPKALYVGTGGAIVMQGVDGGGDQTWSGVPSGAVLPFRARYIRATGTTAADILALY
ncbi:MAG: spike base protein, RCAP_Rcc01079 family [Sphingomonas sp.]